MQNTNPSKRPEPGINDELIYGRTRCTGDDEMYYDPKCFTYDGSGMKIETRKRGSVTIPSFLC